jgi:hypothetical protein
MPRHTTVKKQSMAKINGFHAKLEVDIKFSVENTARKNHTLLFYLG